MYRLNYTDPWIEGDDKRSFTIQNSKTSRTLVHDNRQSNGGNVSVERGIAGIEYSRPLRPKWSGIAGIILQHASACNGSDNLLIRDFYGCPLTASDNQYDDSLLGKIETVYTDFRDHGTSVFVFNIEQGIPILPD
jgi:outer membrane protein insertion porin family